MTRYRIGQVAELLAVSADTVRRLADSGELPSVRTAKGQREIEATDLARYLAAGARGASLPPIVKESARNRMAGIVTRVVKDRVAAQVELQAGPYRIVSLMTRDAVDELRLTPGMRAVASVKATNVVVEVPDS